MAVLKIKNADGTWTHLSGAGQAGEPGADGTVAFENLTQAQRDSLKGDPGPAGPPGEKGDPGSPGIYYGAEQPTVDSHPVWIDPKGEAGTLGNVFSVCGVSPDDTGNVSLNAGDVGAATQEYVDSRTLTAAVTLTASGWADNIQTVPVAGVTADETQTDVFASPAPGDDNYTAYQESGVWLYAQLDDAVQFKCTDVPAVDLTVNVMVRR